MMLRPAALILALAASTLAWGEALDPPERLARLSYVEGRVTFQGAESRATSTLPDRPLLPGDTLVTERGGRAEFAFGTATIRLDERSEFAVVELDETIVRVELVAGTASVYLRELGEDETFEIVTPNAAIALAEPGEYRVDVDDHDTSYLTVRQGAAEVATADGPVRVAAGQRVRLEGRDALARLETPPEADAFDDWVLERELRLADAELPRYTPYEDDNYGELDRYGEWYDEPRYGRVWMPSYGYGGRSPYYDGYWQRVGFGWSWFNPAPWGFYTFHSGRWAYLHDRNRWCWVPERRYNERHLAFDDTRPFGQPRRDVGKRGAPVVQPRVAPDARPRDVALRPRDDNVKRPVVRADRDEPRVNTDRRREPQGNTAAGWHPRNPTIVPSANRDQSPPPRPAAEAPRRDSATLRPARAPEARPQQNSDAAPRSGRAFGRPLTQEP
ncbi:MAG: DUF6600 domain-containing protein [Dongiaceae bacterium]